MSAAQANAGGFKSVGIVAKAHASFALAGRLALIDLFKNHYTVRAQLVEAHPCLIALRHAQGERIWFVTNYEKIDRARACAAAV
ncbi:MAG: hypothetical protein FJY56_12285 [Betaproteobacteria bacterium]|nr:hypothetical protein [Betaproteobacteria bacterium]